MLAAGGGAAAAAAAAAALARARFRLSTQQQHSTPKDDKKDEVFLQKLGSCTAEGTNFSLYPQKIPQHHPIRLLL